MKEFYLQPCSNIQVVATWMKETSLPTKAEINEVREGISFSKVSSTIFECMPLFVGLHHLLTIMGKHS